MIECIRCKTAKEDNLFAFRNKALQQRHKTCKECTRVISTEWYNNNKQRHHATSKVANQKWKKKLKSEAQEAVNKIKDAPCFDCGRSFKPWQMQFDHLDPTTKKFNIATAVHFSYTFRLPEILEEISKCQLVCANCHADRTYYRRMNQ